MQRRWWMLATAILVGVAIGLGSFTFVYAKGHSYITDDPGACANCHIMDEHYAAWQKSSHSARAVCNDCHTPKGGLFEKYLVKAKNGFWHSLYFTTGGFPDPLRITESNHEVTEQTCRGCHQQVTDAIEHGPADERQGPGAMDCTHCHQYVGHLVR